MVGNLRNEVLAAANPGEQMETHRPDVGVDVLVAVPITLDAGLVLGGGSER